MYTYRNLRGDRCRIGSARGDFRPIVQTEVRRRKYEDAFAYVSNSSKDWQFGFTNFTY